MRKYFYLMLALVVGSLEGYAVFEEKYEFDFQDKTLKNITNPSRIIPLENIKSQTWEDLKEEDNLLDFLRLTCVFVQEGQIQKHIKAYPYSERVLKESSDLMLTDLSFEKLTSKLPKYRAGKGELTLKGFYYEYKMENGPLLKLPFFKGKAYLDYKRKGKIQATGKLAFADPFLDPFQTSVLVNYHFFYLEYSQALSFPVIQSKEYFAILQENVCLVTKKKEGKYKMISYEDQKKLEEVADVGLVSSEDFLRLLGQ